MLENIRSQVANALAADRGRARGPRRPTSRTFLRESGVELADVVRRGTGRGRELRRDAGLPTCRAGPRRGALLRRVRAFAHVDDPERAAAYRAAAADDAPSYDAADSGEQRLARMLFFSLWPDGGGFASYADGLAALRSEPARARRSASCRRARPSTRPRTSRRRLLGELGRVPLQVHARYQREEILAALDYGPSTAASRTASARACCSRPRHNADAFLVTLQKSEADYSPTTMYRDYAISPELFHWESQSARRRRVDDRAALPQPPR